MKKQTTRFTQAKLEKIYCTISGTRSVTNEVDRRGVIMLACCVWGPNFQALVKHLDSDYSGTAIKDCLKKLQQQQPF